MQLDKQDACNDNIKSTRLKHASKKASCKKQSTPDKTSPTNSEICKLASKQVSKNSTNDRQREAYGRKQSYGNRADRQARKDTNMQEIKYKHSAIRVKYSDKQENDRRNQTLH